MGVDRGVLLLESDRLNTRILEKKLIRRGIGVRVAREAGEFRELLDACDFGWLMVDAPSVKSANLDLISWARQTKPDARIVALSDCPSGMLAPECVACGADLVAVKPIDDQTIGQTLTEGAQPAAFSGFVENVNILEYFQFLMWSQKNAILELSSNGDTGGRIFLRAGEPVHAQYGDTEGEEALLSCLRMRGGRFWESAWLEPRNKTVHTPGTVLLIEAARLRDESRKEFWARGDIGGDRTGSSAKTTGVPSRMRLISEATPKVSHNIIG